MMRAKCSGAKRGMPLNSRSRVHSDSVSPMRSVPRSITPITSPGHASSTAVRSRAMNCCGDASRIGLPVRTCFTCMPASKRPEQIANERDAVAMLRVHVRLDLEHEAGEAARRSARSMPVGRFARRRLRRELEKLLEKRLDAEVRERAAEEHRRQLAREHGLFVERMARFVEQRDVMHEPRRATRRRGARASSRIVERSDLHVGATARRDPRRARTGGPAFAGDRRRRRTRRRLMNRPRDRDDT